ncbi:MAG: pyridoxamine 5'-phosphate oxidase family protein [Dysgonamonadaceae bacterium]|jgi:uncharacterized pyridoxamine 5'-phosphate oxidase family protein|nr:pyridoxamine 5'-phosphate oxidase family protein [Dysgonamonadaceae bacterium]
MNKLIKLFLIALLAVFCLSAKAQTNEKKEEQPMKEVCNFLKQCGKYFIATVEGDQPRVRPFGTAAIYENRLYIQTGKRKNVAKQMMANPKIEICAYDEPSGRWLRIEAMVVPDERVEAKQFMLDEYPSLKGMYSATDDNTFLLYLENVTATFYSFEDEPRTVNF